MKRSLFDPRPWRMWNLVWKKRGNTIHFTMLIGLFFSIAMVIPYTITNRITQFIGWTVFDPKLSIDESIPYIPLLNLAYISYYAYYILIPFFARNETQQKCAIMFSQRLYICTIPVFLIFLLLPVEVDLRIDVKGDDVLTSLLTLVHSVDQPYNAWPSLHVTHSLCVVLSVPLIFNLSKYAHVSLWVAWVLLTISTMTTQQHYLFDVVTGMIYAVTVHQLFIRPVLSDCKAGAYDLSLIHI